MGGAPADPRLAALPPASRGSTAREGVDARLVAADRCEPRIDRNSGGWGRKTGAELASFTSRRDRIGPQSRVMRSTTLLSAARIAASPPNWNPSWDAQAEQASSFSSVGGMGAQAAAAAAAARGAARAAATKATRRPADGRGSSSSARASWAASQAPTSRTSSRSSGRR